MLPVIQEQLLIIKALQGVCQALLCLSLGYLLGEVLLTLPGRFPSAAIGVGALSSEGKSSPRLLTGKRTGLFIALILACNLLLMKISYRTALFTGPFWGGLTVLFIAGLALILVARQHLRGGRPAGRMPLAAALAGDLLLLAICYILLNAESLLLKPEVWPFLGARSFLLLSWHGALRFVQFALLALLVAGAVQLHNRQGPHRRAQVVMLGAALLWAPCQVLELLLVPELARSQWLYLPTALALLTAAALAGLTLSALLDKRPLAMGRPLTAIVVLALLWVLGAQLARENTLDGAALTGLQQAAPPVQAAPTPSAPAPLSGPGMTVDIDARRLFKQKCSVCHSFDRRLVGPPLNAVLDKYRPDQSRLTGFLLNPQKVDPAYPAMPDLNLSDREAGALTDYLLDQGTDRAAAQ